MNLWLRLLWLWIIGGSRTPVPPLRPCRTPFRVSLFDLHLFRHMNNGRYFTIMDLARVDLMRRSGLLARLDAAGFLPVVTAESMFFRKSLNCGNRFEIASEVIGWDEKSIVMSQRFFVGIQEVAGGLGASAVPATQQRERPDRRHRRDGWGRHHASTHARLVRCVGDAVQCRHARVAAQMTPRLLHRPCCGVRRARACSAT